MNPPGRESRRLGRWLAWALAAALTVVRGAEPATFAGDWNCDWGVLRIELNGQRATGTAAKRNSRIEATVSADGRTLDGRWLQSPSFAGPKDAGRILLTLSPDGNAFNGRWGYGSATDGGPWNGRRVGTSPPPPPPAPPAARSSAKGDLAGSLFALGSALMELKEAGKALGDAISGNPGTPAAAPPPPAAPEPVPAAAEPVVVPAAPTTVVRAPTTGATPPAPVVAVPAPAPVPTGAWVLARIEREEKRAPGPQGYDTYEQSEHSDTALMALAVSPSAPVKISAEWKSPPSAGAPGRTAEIPWSLGVAMTAVAGEGSLGFTAPGQPEVRVTKPGTGNFAWRFPPDGAGGDFVVSVAAAGFYESDGQVTIAWQKRRFVYVFDLRAVPP